MILRRRGRAGTGAWLLLLFAAVFARDRHQERRAITGPVREYWTPSRMRVARPVRVEVGARRPQPGGARTPAPAGPPGIAVGRAASVDASVAHTPFPERIHGTTGGGEADRACGGAGRDRLAGDQARDELRGGSGRTRLIGGPGRDLCVGVPGRDRAHRCERKRRI